MKDGGETEHREDSPAEKPVIQFSRARATPAGPECFWDLVWLRVAREAGLNGNHPHGRPAGKVCLRPASPEGKFLLAENTACALPHVTNPWCRENTLEAV